MFVCAEVVVVREQEERADEASICRVMLYEPLLASLSRTPSDNYCGPSVAFGTPPQACEAPKGSSSYKPQDASSS